jgi:hypothetical protein
MVSAGQPAGAAIPCPDLARWVRFSALNSSRLGPEGSRAEPLLRGRLLGKGRLLEPKSPLEQNSRLRAGIRGETGGVTLVSRRHGLPAIPIAPL